MSDDIFTKNNSPSNTSYAPPDSAPPDLEEITPKEFESFAKPANNPENQDPHAESAEANNENSDLKDIKPAKIVRRADWGALKPNWIEALQTPIRKVAVSFTETDPCYSEDECIKLIKNMQTEHLAEKNVADIKHNFLIGGDGVIYEGRGYTRVGPVYAPSPKKIEELNGCSIDIAIIERSTTRPSQLQVQTLSYCMANGVNGGFIEDDFKTYYIIDDEIDQINQPDPSVLPFKK